MSEAKKYDRSYKERSVKLALEIGVKRAGEELKIPYGTLYGWVQAANNGDLDIEERTPENAMSLAEEIRQLRSEVKRLNKEMAHRDVRLLLYDIIKQTYSLPFLNQPQKNRNMSEKHYNNPLIHEPAEVTRP